MSSTVGSSSGSSERASMGALMILAALNLIAIGLFFAREIYFTDFDGQWQLCAYALRGVDPYELIGRESPLIEELGSIPRGWGAAPWGLLLGNIFYAGFLPLDVAKIYFVVLNVVVLLATAWFFYRSTHEIGTLIVLGCSAGFAIATLTGNAGGVICALLLLSTLTAQRRPFATGILLSLAMVKPQVALAFGLLFLIERRWKILLTAAAIDLGAWLIVSLVVGRLPWTLLREFLGANVGGGAQFSGVFTLLIEEPLLAMLASMIFGAAFIVWLRSVRATCLAASFWTYSFFSEFYLLVLPALECFRSGKKIWGGVLHVGLALWAALAFYLRRQMELGALSGGVLAEQVFCLDDWIEVRTVFAVLFIVVGVVKK